MDIIVRGENYSLKDLKNSLDNVQDADVEFSFLEGRKIEIKLNDKSPVTLKFNEILDLLEEAINKQNDSVPMQDRYDMSDIERKLRELKETGPKEGFSIKQSMYNLFRTMCNLFRRAIPIPNLNREKRLAHINELSSSYSKIRAPLDETDVEHTLTGSDSTKSGDVEKEEVDQLDSNISSVPVKHLDSIEQPKLDPLAEFERAYTFKSKPEDVYALKTPLRASTSYHFIRNVGGAANVGFALYKKNPNEKIGVMLAANSGLPGGSLSSEMGRIASKHLGVPTQEESVLANAILTICGVDPDLQINYHKATIDGKWGMKELQGFSTQTIQNIDFTNTEKVDDYNQAFMISKSFLSAVDQNKEIIENTKFPVVFAFADSVNANPDIGSKTGTMKRTLNQKAINDYVFFRECVKQKLRSALDGMASEGVTIPLVAQLSGGIYAGKHKNVIRTDFGSILQEVLDEEVGPLKEKRGLYFSDVIIPQI